MKLLLAILLLLAPSTFADVYGIVEKKIMLPEAQVWNMHGHFWDWYAPECLLLLDSGEKTPEGETIYDAVLVTREQYENTNVGCYWPYCGGGD